MLFCYSEHSWLALHVQSRKLDIIYLRIIVNVDHIIIALGFSCLGPRLLFWFLVLVAVTTLFAQFDHSRTVYRLNAFLGATEAANVSASM